MIALSSVFLPTFRASPRWTLVTTSALLDRLFPRVLCCRRNLYSWNSSNSSSSSASTDSQQAAVKVCIFFILLCKIVSRKDVHRPQTVSDPLRRITWGISLYPRERDIELWKRDQLAARHRPLPPWVGRTCCKDWTLKRERNKRARPTFAAEKVSRIGDWIETQMLTNWQRFNKSKQGHIRKINFCHNWQCL